MSDALWDSCLENLTTVVNEEDVSRWLMPLEALSKQNELILYAPNKFVCDEVNKRFIQTIELVAKKIDSQVTITVKLGSPATLFDAPRQSKAEDKYISALNPTFTFDSYVEGASNQIAAKSALGVANNPNGSFNPLLIYGSTGLGKSHLMHAIGNQIKSINPKKKVVYQTAEQFVAEMVNAISQGKIDAFKKHYRAVDVLLVDDVQFIAGKEKSQEEFFHLFNTLLSSRSQVVLTCDKYPKDVENLEERLKSRFGAGLSVAVEPPDLETRVAILKKKAAMIAFELDDKVAFFIAEKVRSHVRDLEGALNSVFALSQFNNQPATIDLAKMALRDILNAQQRQISVDNIQKTVANYYHIKVSDIKSKSRKASVARPRQVAMAIAKQLTNLSLPDIGDAFDRDHTTVMHAVKKIDEMKNSDPRIREDMTNLITTLTS
ncbi:chromosomal replication initiator protein DnaA [Ostreibacterium oceani]|uniref:Chromosomal replication initiator protein DnaA n=1 Tax=Ostreibacterium oceani TaxID=2654998 RepID=A0A6N7EXV5_9GAMM|nr:chromosomal replication initiator protein DnaA [Ostreibacterium oceani]MPV85298.1 chromosomal replication initiator protein DnaA [Ostreibacterium oceani]